MTSLVTSETPLVTSAWVLFDAWPLCGVPVVDLMRYVVSRLFVVVVVVVAVVGREVSCPFPSVSS